MSKNCCAYAHSQNRYETVSIFILQNSHRAEPTILHFVKNWLVGTILYWKLRNLISFVDLNTIRYIFSIEAPWNWKPTVELSIIGCRTLYLGSFYRPMTILTMSK